jgi:hypothetical protein
MVKKLPQAYTHFGSVQGDAEACRFRPAVRKQRWPHRLDVAAGPMGDSSPESRFLNFVKSDG